MQDTVMTIGRAKVRLSEVNRGVHAGGEAFFASCNENYEKKIKSIAKRIAADPQKARIIMLSGPSASGKTTTSIKIQKALEEKGISAITISMDDFFINIDEKPLLPDGTRDFESLAALDVNLLEKTLNQLVSTGKASLPVFNFKTGHRADNKRPVVLDEGHVAVVEGLHALDTDVTKFLPAQSLLKLYVSVSSDYVDADGQSVLTARDMRLIRRTVRDFQFRAHSPEMTLGMWDSVCRGEDLYVRPFKKYADITVNSAFDCEPCLFKEIAVRLFSKIGKDSLYYERARHILDGLDAVEPLSMELMPPSCLLREFAGGSEYYGKNGNIK